MTHRRALWTTHVTSSFRSGHVVVAIVTFSFVYAHSDLRLILATASFGSSENNSQSITHQLSRNFASRALVLMLLTALPSSLTRGRSSTQFGWGRVTLATIRGGISTSAVLRYRRRCALHTLKDLFRFCDFETPRLLFWLGL